MRFYFHFRENGKLDPDELGVEFDTLEAAYLGAFTAAQDMWHERLLAQRDPRGCAFEIADASGRLLISLPFTEVLDTCRTDTLESSQRPKTVFSNVHQTVDRSRRLRDEVSTQLALVHASLKKTKALAGGKIMSAPIAYAFSTLGGDLRRGDFDHEAGDAYD